MAEASTAPVGGAVKKAGGVFKRIPQWAWVASGGVVLGVLYMRRTRAGEAVDVTATQDATAPADYGQTGQAFTAGYVDVPYSSAPVQDQSSNQDVPGIIAAVGSLIPSQPDPIEGTASIIGALAPLIGGGAPQSSTTQTPPAPVAQPAPPPPKAPPKVDKCTGEFPFEHGGDCYKVVCASGKGEYAKGRWHFYKSGKKVRVSATC